MIDLKNKDEQATTLTMLGSLVVLLAAGGAMLFIKVPSPPSPQEQRKQESHQRALIEGEKKKIVAARAQLASMTWEGTPDDVAPQALKLVNSLIVTHHLKLVGFHTEKPAELPNVTLIPYVMSVDGTFSNVMAFARDLEKPATKLAMNMLQISNADQSDDKVTASIGITAYQLPAPKSTDSASTSSVGGSTTGGTAKPGTSTSPSAKPGSSGSKMTPQTGSKKEAKPNA